MSFLKWQCIELFRPSFFPRKVPKAEIWIINETPFTYWWMDASLKSPIILVFYELFCANKRRIAIVRLTSIPRNQQQRWHVDSCLWGFLCMNVLPVLWLSVMSGRYQLQHILQTDFTRWCGKMNLRTVSIANMCGTSRKFHVYHRKYIYFFNDSSFTVRF